MLRLAVLLGALSSLGMTCGPPSAPPEPDVCGEPGAGAVTSLEIGPETSNGQPFSAWAAADTAYVSWGDQGGAMVGVTLRLGGDAVPACLAQRTRLRFGGDEIEVDVPVHTYAGGDARVTRTLWLIFDGAVPVEGDSLELTAEAGGQRASSELTVVRDRHELLALTPLTANPQVGDTIELRLDTVHRPAFTLLTADLSTSDPAVLGVVPVHESFDDQTTFTVEARAAGTAEVVVSYGDQELRASVTVAPR